MKKLRIESLTLKGFRSFQPTTLIFPESGLVLIKGKNLDTGGSSGTGKSNLLHAINFLFECCPFPLANLQSWSDPEPFEVSSTLSTEEGEVVYHRGPTTTTLSVGSGQIVGSKAVSARLRQLTGYFDPSTLGALTYREQQSRGLFLCKTDGEKKEFLSALLHLGKFEDEIEAAGEAVKASEGKVQETQRQADWAKDRVPALEEPNYLPTDSFFNEMGVIRACIDSLEIGGKFIALEIDRRVAEFELARQSEGDELELLIKDLREKLSNVTPDMSKVQRMEGVINKLEGRLAAANDIEDKRYRKYLDERAALCNEVNELDFYCRTNESLRERLPKLESQLQQDNCPTCLQPWNKQSASILAEIETIQGTLNSDAAKEAAASLVAARDQLENKSFVKDPISSQMSQALGDLKKDQEKAKLKAIRNESAQKADLRVELERLSAQRSSFNSELIAGKVAIYEEFRPEQERTRALIYADQKKMDTLQNTLESNMAWNTYEERRSRATTVAREMYIAAAEKEAVNVRAAQTALAFNQDWLGCVKGYLNCIFDEVLNDISHEVNSILSKLPNTAHCTLYFRSETETLKGKVKKRIVPVVTVGNHEAPYKSGCSGGMITVVELAVDLAVSKVVQRRTGCCPGWLILDESFDGLGRVEKESCMEMLKEFAHDKLVLIVDHDNEFKELFDKVIEVESSNGVSRVVS